MKTSRRAEAPFALDNVVLLPHIASGTFENAGPWLTGVDNLHGFF
jgi:lactate dehydrogenase-like 2-hydroxyacid dehydrogenase